MNEPEYELHYKIEDNNWWFVAKRNRLAGNLKKYLKDKPKILDIGCGTGIVMKKFESSADIFGIDNSKSAVDFCKKRGLEKVKVGDAKKIPFDDEKFDMVLALDIIEHIDDDIRVLNEVKRVLKKNGKFFVTVPAFSSLWSNHDIELQHKRRYSKSELKEKLAKAGFRIKKINFSYTFIFPVLLVARMFSKKIGTKSMMTNPLINKTLISLLKIEDKFSFIPYLFGTSVYCLAEKK